MDAKEELILGRQTHLHQLADKLREERVRRVVEPVLSGDASGADMASPDDVEYVRDLGLLARRGTRRIANPIYREVIPRELMYAREDEILQETEWYVGPDGDLDVEGLLTAFQAFFPEHSEHWIERFQYKEAGPQLLLQAFLQRIVNGGGRIERGVRPRPPTHRSPDRLAAGPVQRRGGARDAPPGATSWSARSSAAASTPRSARAWNRRWTTWTGAGGVGPPGDLRPGRGEAVGGEALPARGVPRRPTGDRVGSVRSAPPASTGSQACASA